MVINDDWRLTPSLDAYVVITGDKKRYIYLAAIEKPAYKIAVEKLITYPEYKKIRVDLNEFELKVGIPEITSFDGKPIVMVKNPAILPDDQWYQVVNMYPSVYPLFLELDSSKGEFPGCTFEAIFSETSPSLVNFSAPGMKNYKKYLEEMKRRINCELKKKTKKWVAGNRYDTLKETYYYLGEFISRRANSTDSLFLPDDSMVPVYLYVSSIKDGESTITDVLKNRVFGNGPDDIKVLYTIPQGVSCGSVLENDLDGDDIQEYWDDMINNAVEKSKKVTEYGYETYENIKSIFDIFCYQTRGSYSYKPRPEIVPVIAGVMNDIMMKNWNLLNIRKDFTLSHTATDEENQKALIKSLYFNTGDPNSSRGDYYSSLMQTLGIDVTRIAQNVLINFDESELSRDFDSFLKYKSYFDARQQASKITSRQRVNTTSYHIDVVSIESLFGPGILTQYLKNMVTFAIENFGAGVTDYVVYNVGTKKKPQEYASLDITLDDLIKWVGGVENMSEDLKKEIVQKVFTKVSVIIDKDKEVE